MEFFLEIVLTAVVALLFSFVVAKLVSVATAGGGHGSSSESEEKSAIHVGQDVSLEEFRFEQKMEARVLGSERNVRIVGENVEHVDRFVGEAVRFDELEDAANGSREIGAELEVKEVQALQAEYCAAVSPEIVKEEETIVPGQEEQKSATPLAVSKEDVIAEDISVGREEERKSESGDAVSPENMVAEETRVRGQEEGSELAEERSDHIEIEESGDVAVSESEDQVEESESKEGIQEKTEELNIEEDDDDDWEGIEKSELEKAFAAAAKFMEESGHALEIGNDAKTELYGLHKIATEGPCRDSSPMALMVSARAKWNAWQKLGNMSQEEAMEQYLALVSKEVPDLEVHAGSTFEKNPEMETSDFVPPDSGSLEPPPPLTATDSKYEAFKGDVNEASDVGKKGKIDSSI
ncbi:PREDICTED: acyl-CoA-binding domain-containing protein 3 [Tarenaya hassleriana]|uniref:acyl-CoA-binding domain-containing protein 3 n=1 Tax=Tarenaya hassleriana TaxID=28532 RepID=UPI00053C9104|nr:PREDICTED: acyl-CoA-binding domain-containing protein 3 [Tarenaya hassleriana]